MYQDDELEKQVYFAEQAHSYLRLCFLLQFIFLKKEFLQKRLWHGENIFVCFVIVISFTNAAGPRWNNSIDIDDHNLTINVAVQQCQKNLINAPKSWSYCVKKAINMGSWRGLVPLSLHTGDPDCNRVINKD